MFERLPQRSGAPLIGVVAAGLLGGVAAPPGPAAAAPCRLERGGESLIAQVRAPAWE